MAVIIGILISGILAFYWMNQWAEGAYSTVDAIIMAILTSTLIIASLCFYQKYGQVIGSIPLIGVAGIFIYRKWKSGKSSIAKSSVSYYREKVMSDPKNLVYREGLADTLYDAGMLEQAIFEMRTIVKMGGGIPFQSKMDKWILEKKTQID